jgi:plastocyanin
MENMSKPRKYFVVALVLVVVGSIIAVTLPSHKEPKPPSNVATKSAIVAITEDGFSPETVKIKVGMQIVWVNNDNEAHRVAANPFPTHSSLPALDSKINLAPNSTYRFTFTKAGTYTYHDELHPQTSGTIIVQ